MAERQEKSIHEEVAKTALVWPNRADLVIQIRAQQYADAARGGHMRAITGEVGVFAEVDAFVDALVENGERGGEGAADGKGEEEGCKLHFCELVFDLGS